MNTTHLLYLHGFRSSPQSAKARVMAACVAARFPAVHWWCPQLPPSPRAAVELIAHGTADWPAERMAVIGSSLGGFYATWLAVQRGCKAVLLNPAIDPARDLAAHTGPQTAWHDPHSVFDFRPEYVNELRPLYAPHPLPAPARFLAVIAQGDEVLDWREMSARYQGSPQRVQTGGDHGLSSFEAQHLPAVLDFLQLSQ